MNWNELVSKEIVEQIIKKLEERGITAFYVQAGQDAKQKALDLIPKGSQVLVSTSVTAEQIGLKEEIDNSDKFHSVRKEYMALDHDKERDEIRKLRSTPDVIIGSVHAVTEEGHILIASNTGSQLSAYVYGAENVIFIVGTNKIVKNTDDGIKRIYEHSFPLENERAKKAYGMNSAVNKILILNKEFKQNRIKLVFVKEKLGF